MWIVRPRGTPPEIFFPTMLQSRYKFPFRRFRNFRGLYNPRLALLDDYI